MAVLEVRPITGAIGAEVFGVDLSRPLDPATAGELRQLLLSFLVIFFRNQELDAGSHKAFARHFGPIFVHPYLERGDDPEIVEIRRAPGDKRVTGDHWHTDTTMVAEPPMGSILYGIKAPPFGGDTLFANQYLAYESLSPTMKRILEGMTAIHSDRLILGHGNPGSFTPASSTRIRAESRRVETCHSHPIVRTHPVTGRKALFVNRAHTIGIDGMTEEESQPLLSFLFEHGHRPEFTCRFRWQTGSVAFWDNRCTKHYAVNDSGQFERVMRRVQLQGDAPY